MGQRHTTITQLGPAPQPPPPLPPPPPPPPIIIYAVPPPPSLPALPTAPSDPGQRQAKVIEARQHLLLASDQKHVAFVGTSGVGKSSLINALRGVPDVSSAAHGSSAPRTEDGSAPVGIVETTTTPTRYVMPHSQQPHMSLWDLPGCGTQSVDGHAYYTTFNLQGYNLLVLVVADRFREEDLKIVEQALAWDTPIWIVANKADLSINRELRLAGSSSREGNEANVFSREVVAKLVADVRGRIHSEQVPIFVVSTAQWGEGRKESDDPVYSAVMEGADNLTRQFNSTAILAN